MWPLLLSLAAIQEPAGEIELWQATWEDGIAFTVPGPSVLELHGRFSLEALVPSGRLADGTEPQNETGLRSARLQAFLETPYLEGRAQWEFAGGDVDFKELFLGTEVAGVGLRVGQHREPAGLEALQGSVHNPFPERSAPSQAFTPGRNLGLSARLRSGPWVGWVSGYRASDEFSLDPEGEGHALTARVAWASGGTDPKQTLVHLGGWLSQREDGLRLRARAGTVLLPRLIDTGNLPDADALTTGLESAWQRDGWTLSAEWFGAQVDTGQDDAFVSGAYAQASWRPGGEARSYARGKGAFRGFAPLDPRGSVELAARVGRTDLEGGAVDGGTQNDIGIGVNMQLTERSRWMLHWQQSRAGGAEVRAVLLRLQVSF